MADEKPELQGSDRAWLKRLTTIPKISWRDLAMTLGPALLLSAAALMLALHFVRPAPPTSLSISSGPEGSTYRAMAEKYRDILALNGITLKILPSEGSLDNLRQLTDDDSEADVGFVPSGFSAGTDISDLVSLGSVFYQPLTIFYRSPKPLVRLSELKGRRIAIGDAGSGTRFLALALLKANGIEPGGKTPLEPLEGAAAMRALIAHKVDAIFLTGDSVAPATISQLLHAPGISLYAFPQADAYVRRFRYLSKLEIPAGAFDLGENLPKTPINMLAPTVELVARWDLHPALSDLLIEAAREVNGPATLLQNAGEFPAPLQHDFPIGKNATRYYQAGKGFAYRHLPFWLASLLDRTLLVLVPLLVIVIPGLRLVPSLYIWRVKNRIYSRYGDLMALERATLEPMNPEQREALIQRLEEIERAVIAIRMHGAFADQFYVLRQHILFVRAQLMPAAPPPAAASSPS